MKCAGCGHDNPPDSVFCNACGARLGTKPPAHPAPQTPQQLSEGVLTSGVALVGERKQVTVLFADLKASMELLADRDPEEARVLLDAVLERMMEAVHHYEGMVNQVMGDGIMALFGAPLAHEDHAVRACYAALRMQERVARYADELPRTTEAPIRIRVGLNSGEVVVSSVGSDLRMNYTAVGQTTHLAARMEQMAAPGSILITPSTLRLAERAISVQSLGRRSVKGLSEPVDVYEVTGGVPVRSIGKPPAGQRHSPFVGRDAELAQLAVLASDAAQGRRQIIGISGEPGIGKTRLLSEFLQSPHARDWQVLGARSLSYDTGAAWAPVVELLRRYARLDGQESAADTAAKVSRAVLAVDPTLGDIVVPILALLDALPPEHAWHVVDAPERRRLVLDALTRLLLQQSERQPLMLVFENLQWLDTETRAFIDHLVQRVTSARLMLLLDYRPEFVHDWAGLPGFSEIVLRRLSTEAAEELLDTLLLGDRGLADLKKLIGERSQGNPFFLEEIFHTLLETKALVHEPGLYRLTGDLATLDVPATIQVLIAARIDRLLPDEKLVLQSAAVIGSDVPAPLLAAVTEMPSERLQAALSALVAAGLLEQTALYPDLEYRFRNPLTRDVASASLLRGQRRALHARTVEAIESLYVDRLSSWIDQLAEHASLGEVWPKAVLYNCRAGARAAAHAANVHAVRAYEAALHALDRLPSTRETMASSIDVRIDLLAPLLQRGRLDRLLEVAREAERIAHAIGDDQRVARVAAYLVNYHYLKGEPEAAIHYGDKCLEVGQATGDVALQGLARQYIGQSHHLRGDYGAAERVLRENLDTDLDPTGTVLIASCGWLAWTFAERGELDSAQACVERACLAVEDSAHAYAQAIAWTMTGLVALRAGDHERAILPLARSLETTQRNQLTVWRPIPTSLLGLAFVRIGHVTEGLRLLQDSVLSTYRLGVRAYGAFWTLNLAEGYLAHRQYDQAAATAHEALGLAEAGGERGHEAYAHFLIGEIAARRKPSDPEASRRAYTTAAELAERIGLRPLALSAQSALAALEGRGTDDGGERVGEVGRLLIVARSNPALYEFFARELAGSRAIEVIADRRHAERRTGRHAVAHERRHDQRRQARIEADLRAWQLSVTSRAG